MLVAIDIGNSKIKVGFFEDLNQTVSKVSFFDTNIKSITDISNSINKYIDSLNKDINLAGCIISSVVPNLNKEISDQDWDNFVYNRKSLRGKHWELWQHLSGCRQWIKVERDTSTHEIFNTLKANEEIS